MKRAKIIFTTGAVALIGLASLTAWSAQTKFRDKQARMTLKKSIGGTAKKKWDETPKIDPQARLQTKLRYRGTMIKPRPDAKDMELEIQEEIAKAINSWDGKPEPRVAHFGWCAQQGYACTGWYGVIQEMDSIPFGYTVKVHVYPDLVSNYDPVTVTMDHVIETYNYVAGELIYVGCEIPSSHHHGSIHTF